TTSASTRGLTFLPLITDAASRKSSSRELVQEPMNTLSMAMSVIAVPGSSAWYFSERSAFERAASSAKSDGSGTRLVTGTTWPGFVPQVTYGSISAASIVTDLSNVAPSSVGSERQ